MTGVVRETSTYGVTNEEASWSDTQGYELEQLLRLCKRLTRPRRVAQPPEGVLGDPLRPDPALPLRPGQHPQQGVQSQSVHLVSTVLITIEGVLGDYSTLNGFYPIPDGVKLAHALRTGYSMVLGTVQADHVATEHWLLVNGMTQPAFYHRLLVRSPEQADMSDSELRADQAAYLRREGHDLGLVVSADPATILLVTEMGIPCLLFTNPSYRWAEYRPDKKRLPRPWQDIDEEITRQRELKATDPRLTEQEPERI